jgi:hypothetical protein
MKSVPTIASEGPPPERHADRVVDEMVRWLRTLVAVTILGKDMSQ